MQAQIDIATLKAVNLASSTDAMRYYLNGVLIQVRPHTVTYVATDGHKLLYVKRDSADENTLCGDWILPLAWIKAQKPAKCQSDAVMTVNPANGMLQFTGAIDGLTKAIEGNFPPYERVIPASCDNELAQFDGDQLATFEKFAKLQGLPSPTLHHNGAGPAIVAFGLQGVLGVVMPMRHKTAGYAGAAALLSPAELELQGDAMKQAAE